jgi:hypothetical protein
MAQTIRAAVEAPSKDEYVLIFRPYITLKNGKRLYARWFGLKAFPLRVPAK